MNGLKTLCAGLLAGTLLALIAFPRGIESFSYSLAGVFACLLSIAVTTLLLKFLHWPRFDVRIKFSIVTLCVAAVGISIGLGLFLWRLTLRVSQLLEIDLITSSAVVLICSSTYFGLCYYLLVSAKLLPETIPASLPPRPANNEDVRVRKNQVPAVSPKSIAQ